MFTYFVRLTIILLLKS